MKRCPQCEFIYEEDQRLCDMDGSALVHDPRALPDRGRLVINPPSKPTSKLFVQLGIPLVILGVLGGYVFKLQTPSDNNSARPAIMVNGGDSAAAPSTSATNKNAASSNGANLPGAAASDDRDEANSNSDLLPGANRRQANDDGSPSLNEAKSSLHPNKSALTSPTPRRQRRQSQPTPKKDSKVTSFLKKTGRFLKKPFQL